MHSSASSRIPGPVLVAAGLVLAIGSWLLPVSLKSVSPALLRAAGEDTPSVAKFGRDLVDSEKIGPAAMVLAAARTINDPGAPALAQALDRLAGRQPALVAWGGWDPFLDPIFNLRAPSGHADSTPVLTFLLPDKARTALNSRLAASGSQGVQDILRTRTLTATGRFVPATRPGGQPLDALILLTALLYQGEHLSPSLQRELRGLAETAVEQKDLGELGPFFLDLLSLGRRLDWSQLAELMRRTDSTQTVAQFAQIARVTPAEMPLVYTAALFSDSADRVAGYLFQFGATGAGDLRLALADGQGAVRQLLQRQVPVNHQASPALSAAGTLILAHPQLMLALKYLGCLIGIYVVLRGLDRWVIIPSGVAGATPHLRAGVLATLLAGLFIVASEPFLLKAAPVSEYRLHLHLPVLAATAVSSPAPASQTTATMDTSTLVSIGIFALLQIGMYLICLQKINDISAQDCPPLLKLRLMENEENLFDSGLYLGMMGTAAALVLQVVGVIQPNLLAAYSSNLFGIVCVAFVKIRHVRGFKRRLIMENQAMS